MDQITTQVKAKWPIVIGVLSAVYGLMRCLSLRSLINSITFIHVINSAIVVGMFAGAIGLILYKEWGRKTLLLCSWVAVSQCVYSFITVLVGMGGFPPLFAMLGILTAMLIYHGWPVFLLVWLSKFSISQEERQEEYLNPED